MFLMKVIQKIRFALVIENEIFYINGSETLPPPLTREEEQHIMENIAKGDSKAREPLIVHNLRLVVYIAKKFETPNASAEDLISIGTIGLIKAVNTFSPEKNIKLATYASRCIENEILMFLRKSSQLKNEVSIDEPLNTDWDGNELLLCDVLGSDPDTVNRNIECELEKVLFCRQFQSFVTENVLLWSYASGLTDKRNTRKSRLPTSLEFRSPTYQGLKRKLFAN